MVLIVDLYDGEVGEHHGKYQAVCTSKKINLIHKYSMTCPLIKS